MRKDLFLGGAALIAAVASVVITVMRTRKTYRIYSMRMVKF